MENKPKKRVFLKHRKSSALVISIVIHAVFIVVAVGYVAVNAVMKDEVDFEAAPVERPRPKLKKLQVPVKNSNKAQTPKLRQTIVSRPKTSVSIQMPEMTGVKGGIGYGKGSGLGGMTVGFNIDLFGASRGSGNTFVGRFYDLKQTKDGEPSEIGELLAKANGDWKNPNYKASREKYREVVSRFISGNWDENRLGDYFKAPREKFTTSFMIPIIDAQEAPKAYGVESQVKPMEWLALYRGQICAPEDGKYRFVGRGDDVLIVRVKKDLVIDASWINYSGWESDDPDNGKYASYNDSVRCVVGEWFRLKKGQPVPMEVLIGEEPGGHFFCQLYIQKQGVDYPVTMETYKGETIRRPILPIFKTAAVPDKIQEQMKVNPQWATIAGPIMGVE